MTSEAEWITSATAAANGFLRLGSIRIYRSIEGTGQAPEVEDYPFQGLDIDTGSTSAMDWRFWARVGAQHARELGKPVFLNCRAGDLKHPGFTPFGTSIAELRRTGGDLLSVPCGDCQKSLFNCRCALRGVGDLLRQMRD